MKRKEIMKIVNYQKTYLEEIGSFIQDEYEKERILHYIEGDNPAFVLLVDDIPVAVAVTELNGKEAQLLLYVSDFLRSKGYGTALLVYSEEYLKQQGVKKLNCDYINSTDNVSFFSKRGYQLDFSSEVMYYFGNSCMASNAEIRPYMEDDYLEHRTVIREAFHRMQADLKLESEDYVYPPNEGEKKEFLDTMEERYSMIVDNKIVGALLLDDEEIDDIAILPAYQRKGYGTQLLHFAVNKIREKYEPPVKLWCIVGNHAKEMYLKEGFKPIRVHDISYKNF